MADKNASPAFDADEIKMLFKKASSGKDAFGFAFGLGAKPESCGLLVDLRKSGQILRNQLKQADGDLKKICFGTFTVVNGEVLFKAEKPIKGLVKQLKRRFRTEGLLNYTPVLVDANGNVQDEDSLSEEDPVASDAPAATEAADPAPAAAPARPQGDDFAALKARLTALKPRIESLDKGRQGAVLPVFTKAVAQLRDGDSAATATVEGLERVLDKLGAPADRAETPDGPSGSPVPDAATRLTQALTGLVPRIRALAGSPAQAALGPAARNIQQMIAVGDTAGAVAALRALVAAIQTAEQQQGATPKARAIDIWNDAKETVDIGIAKLQQALRGVGHPDTDRIVELGLAGLSGAGVQTALAASLLVHSRAPGEPAARSAVLKAVADYRTFLAENRLVGLADQNPFGVTVNIATTLGRAMDEIEMALA